MAGKSGFYDKVGTDKRASRPRAAPSLMGVEVAEATLAEGTVVHPLAQTAGERRWAANFDTFWGAAQTYDDLPAGAYRCGFINGVGAVLLKQIVEVDKLILFPDEASADIVAEFDAFWSLRPAFKKRGFLHKRGFMLWGPPGSGKTSTLQILVNRLIENRAGIVLYIDNPSLAANCLQMVRAIEPTRPVVAVMEDIDALINVHGEPEFLSLLDGEAQVDSIVYVATTNYPERLDLRFVDRPSRFDTITEIGMPSAAARLKYLQVKEPSLSPAEMEQWVQLSDGFSVAHLKEMIIAVCCLGQDLDDVVERLREMMERQPKSTDAKSGHAGFVWAALKACREEAQQPESGNGAAD